MNTTSLIVGVLAAVLAVGSARAAEPTPMERAVAAAQAAASAADDALRAAKVARDAADAAQKAADAAKAAAAAAGLKEVPVVVADAAAPPRLPEAASAPVKPAPGADTGKKSETASAYLTANADGGNATIKYQGKTDLENNGGITRTYTISTPLASGAKTGDLATLDGLASGTNVGFAWTRFGANNQKAIPDFLWMGGVQGRLGYKKHKYFNTTTLAEESAERYSKSIAPFAGIQNEAGNVLFLGKFDFQRTYKDADAKVLCPQPTLFPVTCVNGAAGGPKLTTKRISSFTVRYSTEPVDGEVTVSYDQASKVKGIDLPFYFIRSKEGDRSLIPFSAGVRLGWRSDTHDTVVSLFVGSPFVFFGP